jgi:hypothetical protein
MTLGKIIFYILYVPVMLAGVVAYAWDKLNWVVENLYKVAKALHEDIKEI